jgi:hypothetical protein
MHSTIEFLELVEDNKSKLFLRPPATLEQIQTAESLLNIKFPQWLTELYKITSGIRSCNGVKLLLDISLPEDDEMGLLGLNKLFKTDTVGFPDWPWEKGIVIGDLDAGAWLFLEKGLPQNVTWLHAHGSNHTLRQMSSQLSKFESDIFDIWSEYL